MAAASIVPTTTSMNSTSTVTMLAKDQTRLRIERMEAERQQRRLRTKELRVTRAEEERRNLSQGNPGDVDFIGLVRQWREEHGGLACRHDDSNNISISVVGGGGTASSMMIAASSSSSSSAVTTSSDDKICVCVRKRSLNAKELAKLEHDAVTCLHPTATVHSAKVRVDGISKYCDHHTFKFDHAFDELSTTEDVYRYTAKPLVQYVCDGGSSSSKGAVVPRATVFAYGQTGSGKTYTMTGIQRMVAEDIFSSLRSHSNTINNGCYSLENTTCSIAIFEIYGGRIQDLLNNRNRLKVLEDGKGEVVVSGLEEFQATTPSEFLSLIEQGQTNRTTHATEANDVSSRSHAICQILLRDKLNGKLRGKLSLVDLAGSERGNDTKEHNRQRRTESSEINTSLLALKECIRAIDGESKHVPYRQSKLTLILKDCFVSKAARTAMIATLSPGSNSTDHTVNTLRYADRIKEQKVGDTFAPSNRSPMRRGSTEPPTKKSLVERLSPLSQPTVSEDYDDMKDDEYDELEEIMNGDDGGNQVEANGDITPAPVQLSKLDQAVKELFEEEENLLNLHMKSIHENAELLTEEGTLLQSVQGEDYDIDDYATRLGEILDRKLVLVQTVREKLVSFRALLKKEEELSGLW